MVPLYVLLLAVMPLIAMDPGSFVLGKRAETAGEQTDEGAQGPGGEGGEAEASQPVLVFADGERSMG